MIVVFERIRFWDTTALKDTFLWFFGVAFVLFVNLNNAATDEKFFSKIIIGFISVIVIFEFIVNLYTFHIFIELVLVPFTTILVLMSTVAELKPEHKQVKKVFDFILAIIGIVVIIFTIRAFLGDIQKFVSFKNLRDLLLPFVFTLVLLPLIYLMAICMQYESLFNRVGYLNKNSTLARYTKWKIFMACGLNLRKINKFSKSGLMLKVNSKNEVITLVEKFK
jgi:hypothetical protein